MKEKYTYKNFYNKYSSLLVLYSFVVACLAGYATGLYYFLIGLASMLIVIGALIKFSPKASGSYDTIIVDNKSKELVFKSYDDTYKIFPYSEIDEIRFCSNDINDNWKIVNRIAIYSKSSTISHIEFTWQEFSLNFLKKLPNNIPISKLSHSTKRQAYNVFVALIMIIASAVIMHSIR